ncbi:caspase domain-containing protein [Ganoderma leucocontextum]|nr:caspase domain-containing protein [Ganoderma leucocontextum]
MRWGFSPRYAQSAVPYYPQQTSWAWPPTTPTRSPTSPGFGPGDIHAGNAYSWWPSSLAHSTPPFANMMPSPDRSSVGVMSDYGVSYIPSSRSSVDIRSSISPSRYSQDPFLEHAEDPRYRGHRRGCSLSHSRSGHGLHRRHSSYGIPHMMNPSVAFSDLLDTPWRAGRKRALCIGVSYFGDRRSELRGSADNARAVQHFLLRHGYRKDDVRILAEDDYDPRRHPTKVNIIAAMHWLVKGARPGDHLFFHFSGHVGKIRSTSGNGVSGYDDVIFPTDHQLNGYIVDDLMHTMLVKKLPRGCRLTALFDSYHCGSALDLPYSYSSDGRVRDNDVRSKWRGHKSSSADVVSWSGPGCMNSHPYDAGATGELMSAAFIRSIGRP